MGGDGGEMLVRADRGGVARLTLNRPQAFNSLSRTLLARLERELEAIADDEAVRVVVIAGAGGRAFSAGHDLKEIAADRRRETLDDLFTACSRLMTTLPRLPQPVIARVDGIATAAGCQLVAACDLAVAADTARFATSGVKYGLFCSTPMVALSRRIAAKPALEMLLTGDTIDAGEALRLQLVNRVVPEAELDAAIADLADRLIAHPARVIALGKRAFYDQLGLSPEEAYRRMTEVIVENAQMPEFEEGVAAFKEKRRPTWGSRPTIARGEPR